MTKIARLTMFLMLTLGPLCLQTEALTNPEYEADKGQSATCPDPGNQVMSDSWSFIACNCTSYVAWRLNEYWKAIVPSSDVRFWNQYRASDPRFNATRWSNAKNWGYRARELGIAVDNIPKAGAVGWIDADTQHPVGHVFFVEAVSGNQVKISEYNADGGYAYRETWINANTVSGYIHLTPAHLEYLKSLYAQSDTAYLEVLYYQEECRITGLCDASGEGSGSSTRPDFYVKKIWLEDANGNAKTSFKPGEQIRAKGTFKNVGTNSPQDVKVKFYLSNGHNVDSNKQQVGNTDNIRNYNMESGESQTEWEEFTAPTTSGTYNLTTCIDTGNDVTEEHESNNCSDEAVFTVKKSRSGLPISTLIEIISD